MVFNNKKYSLKKTGLGCMCFPNAKLHFTADYRVYVQSLVPNSIMYIYGKLNALFCFNCQNRSSPHMNCGHVTKREGSKPISVVSDIVKYYRKVLPSMNMRFT